ncbi:hypothetical protein HDU81_006738 [Chytriomyces hyalinus]|nr:hypothetical protein HDU81_006738 [Chytriomyces hyalinus]
MTGTNQPDQSDCLLPSTAKILHIVQALAGVTLVILFGAWLYRREVRRREFEDKHQGSLHELLLNAEPAFRFFAEGIGESSKSHGTVRLFKTRSVEITHSFERFLQNNRLTGSVPDILKTIPKRNFELNCFSSESNQDPSCTLSKNSISRPSVNNDCEIVSISMEQMGYFLRIPSVGCCQWNPAFLVCDDYGFVTGINFGSSGLSGALPDSLFTLSQLQSLNLNHNQLESTIPSQLGDAVNLKQIDLSFNKLVGPLPDSVKCLERLEGAFFQHNQLSGTIPAGFGNMTQLNEFNFEYNHFTGSIPQGLGGFGFDHNCLSGPTLVNQNDCLERGGVDARVAVGAIAAVVALIAFVWWMRRVYRSAKEAQRSADTLAFVDPFEKEQGNTDSLC